MSESDHITALLQRWQRGDDGAQDELFQLVYRELRRIAGSRLRNEMRRHTLQATELVHEIYPQLVRQRASWQNRAQFFALASECMRRYLVDHARNRSRQKRGGDAFRVSVSDLKPTEICRIETDDEVLAVDRALTKLANLDETAANVIKHRYFGGMSREEIAEIFNVSPSTIDRSYRFAKAWLKRELAFEFSPYLLSVGQIKIKSEFIQQLKSSGNQPVLEWRKVLTVDILNEIDAAGEKAAGTDLLAKIVTEINKSLLGGLYQMQIAKDALSDEKTEPLPDAHIKRSRRMLEEAFAGQIVRLT